MSVVMTGCGEFDAWMDAFARVLLSGWMEDCIPYMRHPFIDFISIACYLQTQSSGH